ncbi:MAG: carboxylating nicotinate-nucleotide diphosphorylase [Bacteriovoracaceae bacterium]|nr:carboxylating nicotinate-nucleotide diphosphorylase [Bacteriovoracaceae bacterium]
MSLLNTSLNQFLSTKFEEDDLARNLSYMQTLPSDLVECQLKVKSDLVLSGTKIFANSFNYLLNDCVDENILMEHEGKFLSGSDQHVFKFKLPFNVGLTGERIALNLLHRSCSVSTLTKKFVDLAEPFGIAILDTRKTTPGLRSLEKAAVVTGGGKNHRFGQTDMWMIKDNHKKFFGGLKQAVDYFYSVGGFYTPLLAEIHGLQELQQAIELNIKHVMLDNFSRDDVKKAIDLKPDQMTYEVSGGMSLETITPYLIPGVDAISIGSLTSFPERVDLSLKMDRL